MLQNPEKVWGLNYAHYICTFNVWLWQYVMGNDTMNNLPDLLELSHTKRRMTRCFLTARDADRRGGGGVGVWRLGRCPGCRRNMNRSPRTGRILLWPPPRHRSTRGRTPSPCRRCKLPGSSVVSTSSKHRWRHGGAAASGRVSPWAPRGKAAEDEGPCLDFFR